MIVTQDEARAKWCPFTRVGGLWSQVAPNRDGREGKVEKSSNCIASDCMAWQWVGGSNGGGGRGYCGLAGQRP